MNIKLNRETWLINFCIGSYLKEEIQKRNITNLNEATAFISDVIDSKFFEDNNPLVDLIDNTNLNIDLNQLAEYYMA